MSWQNPQIEREGNRWKVSAEYVCEAEDGYTYPFVVWVPSKELAESMLAPIRD